MKSTKGRSGRMVIKPRTRQTWRKPVVVLVSLTLILSSAFMGYFFLGNSVDSSAAVSGEYRSVASGNWNSISTWQKFNGSTWVAATATPTSSDATVTIQSGHTVTITATVTVDQVVVNSGGTLVLNSGITVNLANGTGTDLNVSGIFKNAGVVSIAASAVINFAGTATYQHNFTTSPGTIPTATWSAGSTCEIIGYTNNNSPPAGLQAFQNFTWNCPSNTKTVNLNGLLTTVNGNLTIASTGTNPLYISSNGMSLNVGGNFIQSGGTFSLSSSNTQTSILNVTGDYNQSGGTFSIVDGQGSTGTVNLSGNFSHTGGTLTVGGIATTTAQFVFRKTGTQTFVTSGNTVSGNVDFTVNSGSILLMGTNVMAGRNFTLSAGGGIQLGSSAGITSSGSSGNIQVSGTRNFNTGADYTYDGTGNQVTGNGLPSVVRNLTVNNGNFLGLSQSVSVSGVLNLTTGKIVTGNYEVYTTSSLTTAITGHSSADYVVGNLKRAVAASGAYDFPVGDSAQYEYMCVTLSGCAGTTNLTGKFTPVDPNDTVAHPLDVQVSGIDMVELLDEGYWTLTPNLNLTSGSYTLKLKETGYSNTLGGTVVFSLLTRTNSSSSWTSTGVHNDATQSVSGGIVTAQRSSMTSFAQYGIALGEYLSFASPSLISGSAGQINAIYLFPNVMRSVDAWVKITNISGGAVLSDIDNSATGYNESFQPFIQYAPSSTGYIEWNIEFKKAGTSTDTTFRKMTATGVDVDGGTSGSGNIREFIEATMPTSYALDPATTLTVTNNGGSYRATGNTVSIANIDTAARYAMYQMNYRNIHSMMYRTGSINTQTVSETRQTSLYFRSFGLTNGNIALPIELIFFKAKLSEGHVDLSWATAAEINNSFFTIERSTDGENFEPVKQLNGAGNSTERLDYYTTDEDPLAGTSYYRLKQTDYDGHYSYSDIECIKNGNSGSSPSFEIKMVDPNPFGTNFKVGFTLDSESPVRFLLMTTSGRIVRDMQIDTRSGYNTFEYMDQDNLASGIYIVTLQSGDKVVSKKIVKE